MSASLTIPMINVPKHVVIGRVINGVFHKVVALFLKIVVLQRSSTLTLCVFHHPSLKALSHFLKIYQQAQAKEDCGHDHDADKENAPIALGDDQRTKERKAKSAKSAEDQSCQFFFLLGRHFFLGHNTLNASKYMTYSISEMPFNVNIFSNIKVKKIGGRACQYV